MTEPPRSDEIYRGMTRVFGVVIAGFGIVIIAVTIANGGGVAAAGIWLGLMFVALGVGRLYLSLRGDRE